MPAGFSAPATTVTRSSRRRYFRASCCTPAGVISRIRRMLLPITVLSQPQRMFSIVTSAMPNGPSRMRIISPVIMFFTISSSSAGIGSELRTLRQYRKLVGRPVEVLLTNGVKILAHLDEATDEGVTLSYEEKQAVEGRKRKQPVKVTRSYPFAQIKYTKEWLDFK